MELRPGAGGNSAPTYQDYVFGMVVSSDQDTTGFDLSGVRSVNDFIHHVATHSGSALGSHWTRYPVKVPPTAMIQLDHIPPRLALKFSPHVGMPIYKVDETNHTARLLGKVGLIPMAVSLGNKGHVWAAIRGVDGWYINDDARKPEKVDPSALDGLLDDQGNLVRETGIILFRSLPTIRP